MKISVKTLKGKHFDLYVSPSDTVTAVKKQIEESQGKESFPCSQQLLIHQGKVLKDDTSMEDNKVSENGFLVVMLTKVSFCSSSDQLIRAINMSEQIDAAGQISLCRHVAVSAEDLQPTPTPSPVGTASATNPASSLLTGDTYGQADSNVVAGTNLEETVVQLMEMGGGSWDRETVVNALQAAFNNPERAVDYLYSGIPETAEIAVPVAQPPVPAAQVAPAPALSQVAPGGPNSAPLNLFPQGMPGLGGGAVGAGALDFLRNNPQFQALRTMVQSNPQILQPMLQELGKQNPALLGLINENQAEFLHLINEAGSEGGEGDVLGQMGGAMPQSINVTPEERDAIERLEGMGFERALVIEAFLACDKNEQLAANYLLEHAGDYEDI
ncbi:unnamed protein product [Sphagnum jensenii]|uniref:Ubiquitin receptor RAD23 n=1 Tax=Sphagnum jensenii TaxID=128206 RepID=A0ABP1BN55_9BRYO